MPNAQQVSNWLTMEVSRILSNRAIIAGHFDDQYQKNYDKPFAVGETIYPRLPWRFIDQGGNSLALDLQPIVDRVTSITMNQVVKYHVDFTSIEQALTMPDKTTQGLITKLAEPIGKQMAQDWDSKCARFALENTSNVVGALGTAISDLSVLRGASQKLVELSGWKDDGMLGVVTPGMANQIVGLGQAFFNPQGNISRQSKTGEVGPYANVDWVQSMSLYNQTAGTAVTAITVTGANQAGSSLIVTGTAGQTFKKNDKIAIGSGATGMYAVNPSTRRSILALAELTVTADFTLTGGADIITIDPPIAGPGSQYQNVDALPQDGAAVVLWPGTTNPSGKQGACGVLFANDAFAKVSSPLVEPMSAEHHSVQKINGYSVRMTVTWDTVLSRMVARWDSLGGLGKIESENKSVLLAGSV